ncbi:MAG TPA: PP2C family protein-serine/threonine phosphatase [Terriglobales bacterium]|nr:PP2C family protein-serine/threonine phosphatase [Terriglobales bacterium]
MNTAYVALETLRGALVDVVFGTIFLSIGATACAIAAIRWGRGVRILLWLGIWSGMYGVQTLIQIPVLIAVLPLALESAMPYVRTVVMYLLLISALCAWRELSLGKLKLLLQLEIFVGLAIALAGIGTFVLGGPADKWMVYNHLLAVFAMLVLLAVVLVPKFSGLLVITNHRILAAATIVFASEVLYTNLSSVVPYRVLPMVASFGFAALLISLGYVALEILFTNERRLLSIETELETARQIQSSILPARVPELEDLRIVASYHPMTAVAGDFYQFIRPDNDHLGILVADVTGHGIPAALISSMLKVAMQSVAIHADDPAQVLGGINRILSTEAPGQFASAAYVWFDTENRNALYSAAGHPPLLCWRNTRGELQRIESNGLLLGVEPDPQYPVCSVPLEPSDRFLLYTDGVTETENAAGEEFGVRQLESVLRNNRLQPASELSRQVLSELQKWRPPEVNQQDDITLIVIDVLSLARRSSKRR